MLGLELRSIKYFLLILLFLRTKTKIQGEDVNVNIYRLWEDILSVKFYSELQGKMSQILVFELVSFLSLISSKIKWG